MSSGTSSLTGTSTLTGKSNATGTVTSKRGNQLTTGTLKLKALLDNRDGALFPNQFANIRLQLDTLKGQMAVPVTAVQRGSVGTFVVVALADGTAQIRPVELGAVDGDWQAVKGSLQAGERVVTAGQQRLRHRTGRSVKQNAISRRHRIQKQEPASPRKASARQLPLTLTTETA